VDDWGFGMSASNTLAEPPALADRHQQLVSAANRPRVGRIVCRVRRLLVINGSMTTGDIARSIYGRPTQHWQYERVRSAAARFAVEARRRRSAGAPIVWRLRGP
jgi:hypothetical protein